MGPQDQGQVSQSQKRLFCQELNEELFDQTNL
jgi:hypothetical protein